MKCYNFKIILAGDSGVGKSTLTNKLNDHKGLKRFSNPITKKLNIDGKAIKLRILDPCGRIGEYKPIMRMMKRYFYDTHGILYLYDLTRPETLQGLKKWEQLNKDGNNLYDKCQAVLAGNKSEIGIVRQEDINTFIKENDNANIKAYYLISAKTGENVEKAFNHLVELIFNKFNS